MVAILKKIKAEKKAKEKAIDDVFEKSDKAFDAVRKIADTTRKNILNGDAENWFKLHKKGC